MGVKLKCGESCDDTVARYHTVRSRIIGPHARTLELPLLVRSGSFFFSLCLKLGLRGSVLDVCLPPHLGEGISDVLASGPIILVLTVWVACEGGMLRATLNFLVFIELFN